jgi:hypothetical protein
MQRAVSAGDICEQREERTAYPGQTGCVNRPMAITVGKMMRGARAPKVRKDFQTNLATAIISTTYIAAPMKVGTKADLPTEWKPARIK